MSSDERQQEDPRQDRNAEKSPGLKQILISILGAAFGVQSERVRQRDFAKGRPAVFIIGGIAFTIIFVLVLIVVVNLILKSAGQ